MSSLYGLSHSTLTLGAATLGELSELRRMVSSFLMADIKQLELYEIGEDLETQYHRRRISKEILEAKALLAQIDDRIKQLTSTGGT